ncbi:gene transfer agent family protein [Pararhodobacter zhoushanensis]|uniref:Gene transfer agent family protein n=1 Tax=Pararhodobacter zhoushanensis TaxID=2479545 RepID=A0ABT3H3J0_9RHOB|nr:gene transfer agent family protein [Pararhodobacter zhoushanensis]MCW1934321.1 gene transfer agent family protein [Pararhodobacter zhoushanensis]
MANPLAGEVALVLDGQRHRLKLTLGALVELEQALGADSLVALVERFETGRFSARDVMALILAGLHGGGTPVAASALLSAEIEGGPVEASRVAGQLLARAFSAPGAAA